MAERVLRAGIGVTLAFLIGTAGAAPAANPRPTPRPAVRKPARLEWENKSAVTEHVEKHVRYPATRSDVLEACREWHDELTGADAALLRQLPEGKYRSPAEVFAALAARAAAR